MNKAILFVVSLLILNMFMTATVGRVCANQSWWTQTIEEAQKTDGQIYHKLTIDTSSKDAQLDSVNPAMDWNYGAFPRIDFGADLYGRVFHSLVQFDLPLFLSDVTLTSVTLRLWGPIAWTGGDPSGEAVRVCRVTHDWVEGTGNASKPTQDGVTWNEYNYYDGLTTAMNNWDTPGGDYTLIDSSTAIVPPYPQPFWSTMNWTVTNIVKGWVNNSYPNCGFLVKLDNESAAKGGTFGSKEYQLIEPLVPPPKLEITYIVPTIESCDVTGAQKDSFAIADTVYIRGSGYTPLATYSVYVVNDAVWVDGSIIPQRVSGTIISMTLDASGNFLAMPAWFSPLAPGNYDILVDVNGNGKVDAGLDPLDDNDIQGTAGFMVTEQETWKLTIHVIGSGTTDPVPGVHMFPNGTEAPVIANADAGWIFDHWVLDGTGIEWMNPISITMGRDRDLTAVFIGNPPIVESCDHTGARKDLFNMAETVYLSGSGYGQEAGVDVYVVEDVTWTYGMTIPSRVPGTVTRVLADMSGNIVQTAVWNPLLANGKYDVCVDVNGNGRYDQGIDALDDNDIEVTAGFVIPEFSSFLILALLIIAIQLTVIIYRGKHRSIVKFNMKT